MKFIYYIVVSILVVIVAIVVARLVFNPSTKDHNTALVINDSVITVNEFNRLVTLLKPADRKDFINSLIDKEILIHEALKLGIDKDESFRLSVQNFYEQSLIKLLTEKKINSFNKTISDDELNKNIDFQRKILHLTIFRAEDLNAANKGAFKSQDIMKVQGETLTDDVREKLISLKTGELTESIQSDNGYTVFRIDKIDEPGQRVIVPAKEREEIRKRLEERSRQKMLDVWITDLKKKAVIKNNLKSEQMLEGTYERKL